MEKLPLGERPEIKMAGGASEERKEVVRKLIEGRFGERHLTNLSEAKRKAIEKHELEKHPLKYGVLKLPTKLLTACVNDMISKHSISQRGISIISIRNSSIKNLVLIPLHLQFRTVRQFILIAQ